MAGWWLDDYLDAYPVALSAIGTASRGELVISPGKQGDLRAAFPSDFPFKFLAGTAFVVDLAESVALSESLSASVAAQVALAESASAIESLGGAATATVGLAESASATESASIVATFFANLIESAGVTEALDVIQLGAAHTVNLAEAITVSEALTTEAHVAIALAESGTVLEAIVAGTGEYIVNIYRLRKAGVYGQTVKRGENMPLYVMPLGAPMSCESKTVEIVKRGFSWARLLEVRKQSDGSYQDLGGTTIDVQFRNAPGEAPILTLSVGSGVSILPATGFADLHATPLQTSAWPLGTLYYSIKVAPTGLPTDEVESGVLLVQDR